MKATRMDDNETLNRRARLRELIATCFDSRDENLLSYIENRTHKRPNQGELSAIKKDHGGKSFGDKKAKALTEQIGLHRRWFEMPAGTNIDRGAWLDEPKSGAHFTAEISRIRVSDKNPSPLTKNEREMLNAYRNASPKIRDVAPQMMISSEEWRALMALRKMDLELRSGSIARLEADADTQLLDAEAERLKDGAKNRVDHSQ